MTAVQQQLEAELQEDAALETRLIAGICTDTFEDFIRAVMPEYVFNWHHLILIDALQRLADREFERLIVMMPPRHGKALAVNTPIPTPDGWKPIGSLSVGDTVFDENGMPCSVVAKSEVWKNRDVYRVKTDSGDEIIADGEHEWPVRLCRKRKVFKNKTTKFLFERRCDRNPLLLKSGCLQLAEKDLPVDPYYLGLWIGDGHSSCSRLTCSDADFVPISEELKRRGLRISENRKGISVGILGVQTKMKAMGLMPKKFIPAQYLRASESQRYDLLRGLVDSDGYVAKDGQVEFCSTNERVAVEFKELVNSLGYKASLIFGRATLNGIDCGRKFRVMFYAKDAAFLERKNGKTKDSIRGHHYLTIEPAGKADTVCIQVDSKSHLFLAGKGMIPTHNSQLVSRLFPAWLFARETNEQIILSSYSADLASAMNRDAQRIITGETYRALFPDTRLSDGKETGIVRNNSRFDIVGAKGYLISAGVGGGITGAGATVGIIDDPVKNAQEADSATYRNTAWEWYTTTFKTRFEPNAIEIICQTRWHEDDLTGRVLEQMKQGDTAAKTEIISFPALCEHAEQYREIGEPLWEGKYDRVKLLKMQSDLGSRAWNALYQQRPAPEEGNLIKRDWFDFYDPRKVNLSGETVNFFFDTAYTDKEANDPTAGIAYVKKGDDYYILECRAEWLDFLEQTKFILDFCNDNGYGVRSLARVEPKATGKSIVQVLKRQTRLNILESEPPKDSKTARVNSIAARLEAGRVLLPKGAGWVTGFLDECAAFPNAPHDDRVDCLCGMILSEEKTVRQFRRRVSSIN